MTANARWTLADLERLPDDGNKYEVVRGELFVTPPPNYGHESIASVLHSILEPYIRAHSVGQIQRPRAVFRFEGSEVEPDLIVRAATATLPRDWQSAPKPLLIVEILSDSTRRRDHVAKRDSNPSPTDDERRPSHEPESEPLEKLRVGKILRTSRRALVPDQVISRDHPHLGISEPRGNSPVPGVGKLDAIQPGEKIHAVWCAAQLDDAVVRLEVRRRKLERAKTEREQCRDDALAVRRVGADKEIQVVGQARPAVERDGVATNHQEFNAVRMEQREQLAQVVVQHRRVPRGSVPEESTPGRDVIAAKWRPGPRARLHRPRDERSRS